MVVTGADRIERSLERTRSKLRSLSYQPARALVRSHELYVEGLTESVPDAFDRVREKLVSIHRTGSAMWLLLQRWLAMHCHRMASAILFWICVPLPPDLFIRRRTSLASDRAVARRFGLRVHHAGGGSAGTSCATFREGVRSAIRLDQRVEVIERPITRFAEPRTLPSACARDMGWLPRTNANADGWNPFSLREAGDAERGSARAHQRDAFPRTCASDARRRVPAASYARFVRANLGADQFGVR
jgi:hypothetical protein